MQGDLPDEPLLTLADANARLASNGADIEALLAKGDHMALAHDIRAAAAFYGAVLKVAQSRPPQMPDQRAMIDRAQRQSAWCSAQFQQHLLSSLAKDGFGEGQRPPRFQQSLDMMLGRKQRPPAYEDYPQMPAAHYYPDMPYVSFADTRAFPWVAAIEAQFDAMRAEALAALADLKGFVPYSRSIANRPSNNHHGLLDNPDWSSLYLWKDGAAIDEHAQRCPTILQTIKQHAPLCDLGPRAPTILLSLLRPGAHIPPHCGMLNSRLICHMPLIVPEGCGFRVGADTVQWQEGKILIFDDSVEHEAWNNSDQDRLVVIFDIWRPDLNVSEQRAMNSLFAAVDSF